MLVSDLPKVAVEPSDISRQLKISRRIARLVQVPFPTTLTNVKKADFLKSVGLRTPVFTRFSTVTLGREFPDLARNPRGFAIKFYTGEGNYDIVGLNFVRLSILPIIYCY